MIELGRIMEQQQQQQQQHQRNAMILFATTAQSPLVEEELQLENLEQQPQQQQQEDEQELTGLMVSSSPMLTPTPLRETFPYSIPQQVPASALPVPSSSNQCDKPAANGLAAAAANGLPAAGEMDMEVDKREREHKKRSKNWTRPETLKLIRLRTELEPRFAKAGRKTELWDEIAEALQRERFSRDAQQCRDKWEKLTAGYKEVRDGLKDREDNPFFDELYPLLSGKPLKRPIGAPLLMDAVEPTASATTTAPPTNIPPGLDSCDLEAAQAGASRAKEEDDEEMPEGGRAAPSNSKKRRKMAKYIAVTDVVAVQSLLESVLARQQRFFRELLEAMERKEQAREQLRQEKEDKWRAEERAQRLVFHNAMLALTQKLVGDRMGLGEGFMQAQQQQQQLHPQAASAAAAGSPDGVAAGGPKKRSKNWKRTEVLQLIKIRGDMEAKFARSTRRAALWDEVAELLKSQGIKRDGKQCREKWDKLMAEYKDVADGKREQGESHYFAELTAIVTTKPTESSPPALTC